VWLAIDTATDVAGIALADAAGVVVEHSWPARRNHTSALAPRVAQALTDTGLTVARLDGIAVAIGPGSYTGLRIGLALAKGLAFGADLPLVGIPTLDPLAASLSAPMVRRERDLWCVFRAGRQRLVAARYPPAATDWPDATALQSMTVAELAALVPSGDWVAGELSEAEQAELAGRGAAVVTGAAGLRRAGWLAQLGRRRFQDAGPDDLVALAPIYLGAGP
jgi:tRNA threonylcarbamoyladenosine biosynthesis protein TsaB